MYIRVLLLAYFFEIARAVYLKYYGFDFNLTSNEFKLNCIFIKRIFRWSCLIASFKLKGEHSYCLKEVISWLEASLLSYVMSEY